MERGKFEAALCSFDLFDLVLASVSPIDLLAEERKAYNALQNITYSPLKLYSSEQRVISKKSKFSSAAKKVTP